MLKASLAELISGKYLALEQAQQAMSIIMAGQASDAQIGAFLAALCMRETTGEELTGFAYALRQQLPQVFSGRQELIDTCGTGGDGKNTFNISTTAAFVLAGAGVKVAKHGNRGISSACGSADVLKYLGVNISLGSAAVAQIIAKLGIGFLFAPVFHKAMKYAAVPRRELGFRTIFNVLGPLSNPLQASRQLIGVYDEKLTISVAEALIGLGVKRGMVVHSFDGMDEISTSVPSQVVEVDNGVLRTYIINPVDYGFTPCDQSEYKGGSVEENAKVMLEVLGGRPGPKREIVLINAAAALVVSGKVATLKEGIDLAESSLDSGAALAKLAGLEQLTQQFAEVQL